MKAKPDSTSRRTFLTRAALLPAAVVATGLTGRIFADTSDAQPAAGSSAAPKAKEYPIGLELYSVRGELARDLPNTLRKVSEMGYEVVEFYAPYCDWNIPYSKEVRTLMDDLGLRCYSTHNSFDSFTPGDRMTKAIELNQVLGSRYLILASAPVWSQGPEAWKKLCGQLSTTTEQLKPHGLSAGFHNHQTEWAHIDGNMRVMDLIAANTPKEFVLQLDVGTCVEAGADPVAWIKANPGRIKIAHLKDWAPGTRAEEKGYRVLFGEGAALWKEITDALESVGGVEFYLLEQEGSRFSEFETAQRCLSNWKSFRTKSGWRREGIHIRNF